MRNENDMLKLIINVAANDDRVRAVILNGSRVNPKAPKDIFQDYDILYLVKDMDSFINNNHWIDIFGERIMMQMPEKMQKPLNRGFFSYLMLFTDGNRIDLTLIPLDKWKKNQRIDSLSKLLLDKDNLIGSLPSPSDKDYYVKQPTQKEFFDTCNEFWWICTYIAKGLWRQELPYVNHMKEHINRSILNKMLAWYIGIQYNFNINPGKFGKYVQKYLTGEEWQIYLLTFSDSDYDKIWSSLFCMIELFRDTALKVANKLNFEYCHRYDKNVSAYLRRVKNLPKNAEEIY